MPFTYVFGLNFIVGVYLLLGKQIRISDFVEQVNSNNREN
jgi:hypothetical protein